mmetsp:Transcript_41396/g.69048  ORF Transcript_41396/g.69048 Transcript_41396/m.69048 type:complete len:87 (-) Transcript_41396:146-406(-)
MYVCMHGVCMLMCVCVYVCVCVFSSVCTLAFPYLYTYTPLFSFALISRLIGLLVPPVPFKRVVARSVIIGFHPSILPSSLPRPLFP